MAQGIEAYVHDPPGRAGGMVGIKVRGTRDGLVLSLPEDARTAPSKDVAAALVAHLDSARAFFSGAEVVVDLGARTVTEDEVSFYRLMLEEREVQVRGFSASTSDGRALLRKLGYHPLHVVAERPQSSAREQVVENPETLYLRRTLRSGTRVRHPGNLIIVGDINAGAEATASGDIIVWGVVRGTVHAGALGDTGAIICALALHPTQLRISSHYALPPADKQGKPLRGPERARLENGQLVVEPWKSK